MSNRTHSLLEELQREESEFLSIILGELKVLSLNAQNKRLLLIVGICAIVVLGVVGVLRHAYPSVRLLFHKRLLFRKRWSVPSEEAQAQAPEGFRSGGLAVGLDVHSGEYNDETKETYFPYQDHRTSVELAATLRIRSDFTQTEVYALAVLLDYVQIPLTVTHTSYPVYLVQAEPYDPMSIDFSLSIPNQPGRHQLCLVLFQGADVNRLNRVSYGFLEAANIYDIVIGEDTVPEIVYQEAPMVFEFDPKLDVSGVQINQDPRDGRQPWISATVPSGKVVDYYVHVGNAGDDEWLPAHPYVLVAWLDWQQIPLGAGDTPAFFGYLEAGERQIIPAQVEIPADRMGNAGVLHELQLLYIAYPHARMTPYPQEGAPWPRAWFSQRTTLIAGE